MISFSLYSTKRIPLVRFLFPSFQSYATFQIGEFPSLPHGWLDWDCLIKFFSFPLFTPSWSLPVKLETPWNDSKIDRTLFLRKTEKESLLFALYRLLVTWEEMPWFNHLPFFLFVYSSSISVSPCVKKSKSWRMDERSKSLNSHLLLSAIDRNTIFDVFNHVIA